MKTVDLKNYDNTWFSPGKNLIVRLLWYVVNALIFNSYLFPFSFVKVFLLRFFGAKVGHGVVVKPKVNIKYPWKLAVGDHSWVGEKVWIDNLDQVTIGSNCCLSQGAMVLCGNHNYRSTSFDLITKPIVMKDGAWMGAKSVACPGVIIERNAVLSVGAIATSNLKENAIYMGNPAIKVKEREINTDFKK